MAMRTSAPFRADHVGSLLRSAAIARARAERARGEMSVAELTAIEDREIVEILRKQHAVGLRSATDGEFRRAWWHFDFFGLLGGVELRDAASGIQFQGRKPKPRHRTSWDRLAFRPTIPCSNISVS